MGFRGLGFRGLCGAGSRACSFGDFGSCWELIQTSEGDARQHVRSCVTACATQLLSEVQQNSNLP